MCPEESQIIHEILAYLADHPEAQDTLEGIVEWWLLERRIIYQTRCVKAVLDELIALDWIDPIRGADMRISYRMNRKRAQEIQAFLGNKSK
ncbi:MAG: hypothetical protein CVU57_20810 [Deltaproteobacteria bacterium HGW-Deltaproteobacteria-15]|jgi:hypothetical protein|nr:MAG: hypothetical protein CVU57_20810 [Deltaproteobacteria bacterium HGW-Deltaproteobacteria-15]